MSRKLSNGFNSNIFTYTILAYMQITKGKDRFVQNENDLNLHIAGDYPECNSPQFTCGSDPHVDSIIIEFIICFMPAMIILTTTGMSMPARKLFSQYDGRLKS